jgi:hypothetical protein
MPQRHVLIDVIHCEKGRLFGSALILLQGVVTALFPQASVRLTKKMIGKNFDNASELEAKPAYIRQLRAIGVGMIAAGGTGLLLEDTEELEADLSGLADAAETEDDG